MWSIKKIYTVKYGFIATVHVGVPFGTMRWNKIQTYELFEKSILNVLLLILNAVLVLEGYTLNALEKEKQTNQISLWSMFFCTNDLHRHLKYSNA